MSRLHHSIPLHCTCISLKRTAPEVNRSQRSEFFFITEKLEDPTFYISSEAIDQHSGYFYKWLVVNGSCGSNDCGRVD